ncbi:aminopeptidase [Streptomyces cinnamoneus]|uniref:Aminopeptidase n=1 Tax=Streptomyces cinnamoneus TaxID=53446 RepID=A0A2G1XP02_STRCJ|nr:S28 family serine protease [Streptomyces cinnamoneus]PHQ52967.1 aminopeptidase [Streptomyces cinnamoneus]PPT11476.1 aminopeptidase [Streptomyces cinnamoneus]
MRNTTPRRPRKTLLLAALACLLGAGPVHPARAHTADDDIRARVEAVPGMRVIEEESAPPGYRSFTLGFRQPVDHRHPAAGTFEQKLRLLHRSAERPVVVYNSGYALGKAAPGRTEPAELLDGNQLSVEHRFFGDSRPSPVDWSKLDIWQAASDQHDLVQALKKVYRTPWISTGGSKGGMATVYHRRFYPHDVDGSVVYSAPDNVDDRDDSAYDAFVERLGTPACREALKSAQREVLTRREAMAARYARWAEGAGLTFRTVGSADRALELAVLRVPLMFWEYGDESRCAKVPGPSAPDDDVYAWLDDVSGLKLYTDQSLEAYQPYFYQLGTQLGYAQFAAPHLAGLLRHPGVQEVRTYVPRDVPLRFQPQAMNDVDQWVRRHGSRLLFVYGGNDPASAEPFRLGGGSRDSAVFVAPATNHRARIAGLRPEDAARATASLRRWASR